MTVEEEYSARARRLRHLLWPGALAAFVFLLCGLQLRAPAESVRVTGWNLQGISDAAQLKEAAENLKPLNPDVILLAGAGNWQVCQDLAEALKPEQYHVLICSSFREVRSLAPAAAQAAVLGKVKAYFSWSEPWRETNTSGGFAFAALQIRGQRLGFMCASVGEPQNPGSTAPQLLQQTEAVAHWEVNRVQSFVIGLSCQRAGLAQPTNLSRLVDAIQAAGYTDTMDALAADQRVTVASKTGQPGLTLDFILAQSTLFPSPQRPRSAVMGRYPVTCDLELDPARVAAAWTARAQELQVRSTVLRAQEAAAADSARHTTRREPAGPPAWWWSIGGAMAMALVFLMWFISRVGRQAAPHSPALLPEHVQSALTAASSYTVVVSTPPPAAAAQPDPPPAIPVPPLVNVEMPGVQISSPGWEQRARTAEQEAEQAKLILKHKLAGSIGRWLKKRFVRKLVADRAQLLEAQESAALKAIKVDERLERIERQIQQQTQSYERRIEELTLELLAAREENRELIRARIAQVKLEMEAVRTRMRAAATKG